MSEEVRLIVSSPVLREIDHLKTKGNDRVGRRARAASAMFREMLDETHKLVHAESPRVVLSVEPQHTYNRDLEDRLDYQERDDQLLGTVYEFARSNPSSDVRLLTHDTTPLYTARGLNLTADLISDDWLLPPETTETEKKLTAIEAENARLKTAEPSFSICCANQSDAVVDRYCASYTWSEPLTDAEVDGLMQRLKVRFPWKPISAQGNRKSGQRLRLSLTGSLQPSRFSLLQPTKRSRNTEMKPTPNGWNIVKRCFGHIIGRYNTKRRCSSSRFLLKTSAHAQLPTPSSRLRLTASSRSSRHRPTITTRNRKAKTIRRATSRLRRCPDRPSRPVAIGGARFAANPGTPCTL